MISERTEAALKAAKARGVRLGGHGAEVLAPQHRQEAHQRAMELEPVITSENRYRTEQAEGRNATIADSLGELVNVRFVPIADVRHLGAPRTNQTHQPQAKMPANVELLVLQA